MLPKTPLPCFRLVSTVLAFLFTVVSCWNVQRGIVPPGNFHPWLEQGTIRFTASFASLTNPPSRNGIGYGHGLCMTASETDSKQSPTTFREAEVLGLRLMQEGLYKEALKAFQDGMKLSGSRPDVIRKQYQSGPSPVGGAIGGFESDTVLLLDEFELQAAHYNMACAYTQLGSIPEAVANLKLAFEYGFDNYATVRGDPDLKPLQGIKEFEELLNEYDDRDKGFNPFGMFSKKN